MAETICLKYDGKQMDCGVSSLGLVSEGVTLLCAADIMDIVTTGCTVSVTAFSKSNKAPYARVAETHTLICNDEQAALMTSASLRTEATKQCTLSGVKVHTIVNPNSGTGNAGALWERIERTFDFFGVETEKQETRAPQHAIEIAANLQFSSNDVVCSIGGDGIMHEIVNGLAKQGKRATIAVIPAGSGNGMASTLGMQNFEDATWSLFHGQRVPLDVFKIQQPRPGHRTIAGQAVDEPTERFAFLHMCYGIIADIDFDSEWLRWLGPTRFPLTGVFKVIFLPSYPVKLRLNLVTEDAATAHTVWEPSLAADGNKSDAKPFTPTVAKGRTIEIEDDLVGLHMSNVAEISSNFMTNPFAKLADGCIDVTLIRRSKAGRFQMIDFFNRVESTACSDAPYMEHYKAHSLTLTPLAPTPSKGKMDLDGEWLSYGEVTITCCPSSLNIMAP